jgi:hypothetical protein
MKLFLIVLGSIVPGRDEARWTGLVMLGAVAALAWKGAWKPHPVAMLWLAFLLLSAAAAAAGRVGFGVFYASRYAIYSTALAVLCVMAFHEITRPWNRAALAGCRDRGRFAILRGFLRSWKDVRDFALNGHLLAKVLLPGPPPGPAPYFGIFFPNLQYATTALRVAELQGIYAGAGDGPSMRRPCGHDPAGPDTRCDRRARGRGRRRRRRVTARGWTDIAATVPGRVFRVITARSLHGSARGGDRASRCGPRGSRPAPRSSRDFASSSTSPRRPRRRTRAAVLCLAVEAPGHPATVLSRATAPCPRPAR